MAGGYVPLAGRGEARVNVGAALGDIRAGLAVGPDDGGWIVTAFMVAEIVVIPLSGWLSRTSAP